MGMIELVRSVERRRWSVEEKLSILAEAGRPGATVSATAQRHDLHPNQISRWRQLARQGRLALSDVVPGFAPVALLSDDGVPPSGFGHSTSLVEIALTNGRLVRVNDGIDPARLSRLVTTLDG